ncbi:MAG: ABC-type multidrug transport system permease subunit [Candidatus Krumholzibacteriia bacterium]|jgi:ABC-type multidrug transport system permease subunit
MVINALVRKDIKRTITDRKALIVNLALPLLLTAIMGFSFGGSEDSSGLSKISVAMVANDLPAEVKNRLAEGLEESDLFTVTWTDSITADAWVRSGDRVAAIVLPPDMMSELMAEEFVTVQVWQDPGSPLKSGIVSEILSRMVVRYQAGDAAYLALWPEDRAAEDGETSGRDELSEMFSGDFNTIWQRLRQAEESPERGNRAERMLTIIDHQVALSEAMSNETVTLKVNDKGPASAAGPNSQINLFDYFLPSFSVFFLMFAVAAATRDIHREREQLTLQRQLLSPLRSIEFIIGKWVSASLQGVMQLSVLFLAGAMFFKVNLGPDLYSLPLVIVLTSTAAAGVFMLLALLTSTEKIMDNLSTVVVLVSAMIGGNFVPIDSMPAWAHGAGKFVFNYWANMSFSEVVISNQSLPSAPLAALVLASITVTLFAINVLIFSWRSRRGEMI